MRLKVVSPFFLPVLLLSLCFSSCALRPPFKQGAFHPGVLEKQAKRLVKQGGGDYILDPQLAWLNDVKPSAALTFVNLRSKGGNCYYLVLKIDLAADTLILLPLRPDETPLSVLADGGRREELEKTVSLPSVQGSVEVSLSASIASRQFGSPLPTPQRVYAVAANYPSHLQYDLGVAQRDNLRDLLSRARPRVFLKFPVTPPPGGDLQQVQASYDSFNTILGPFDDIVYPAKVFLPGEGEKPFIEADSHLDYEVEIGIVLSRNLTWQDVKDAPDEQIRKAIAGYVLLSDAKLRNPQVFLRVLNDDRDTPADDPYRIGDAALDAQFGIWDSVSASWWSHAASWGRYTSIGPFFVAASSTSDWTERAMISARSYSERAVRASDLPEGYSTDGFYLRQCSLTSELADENDRLVWNAAQIIRSILAPKNALEFLGEKRLLEQGDIISLGTPGGVVITSSVPANVFDTLEDVFFWRKPLDWHDTFFSGKEHLYLRHGDELFLWAEGLGFQRLRVTQEQTFKKKAF